MSKEIILIDKQVKTKLLKKESKLIEDFNEASGEYIMKLDILILENALKNMLTSRYGLTYQGIAEEYGEWEVQATETLGRVLKMRWSNNNFQVYDLDHLMRVYFSRVTIVNKNLLNNTTAIQHSCIQQQVNQDMLWCIKSFQRKLYHHFKNKHSQI